MPGEALVLAGAQVDAGRAASTAARWSARAARSAPGAQVAGSVLFDGATVGAGAVVTGSVVGRGARIGAGAVLDGAVIGDDGARSAPATSCAHGLRVWPGAELGPTSVRFSTDA